MQHKKIAIEIEVEYDIAIGLSGKFDIRTLLFTEYDSLMESEAVIINYRTALKKLGGFSMLTATLTLRDKNDYGWNKPQDVVKSWRYVKRYDEVTFAPWNGHRYEDYAPSDKRSIESRLKELVILANTTYVQQLKEAAKENVAA
jgi:hypothetical protein